MYFNSILIADIVAHRARFQKFEKGLNVITSTDNHVGKSSLLKSLYHSLGANVKYDTVWDINSKIYILSFTVNGIGYRIIRHMKNFAVFKGSDLLMITNKVMAELSPLLEQIFDFGIYLDSKNTGKVSLAPPAFTFLPYYIDQDSGWSVLYGSFQNQDQYRKNDRIKSLYYHLNIYSKNYVELMAKRDKIQESLEALKKEADRLSEIIEVITDEVQGLVPAENTEQFDRNIKKSVNKIKDVVNRLGEKRNTIQKLQISLAQYEHQLEIITEYHTITGKAENEKQDSMRSCPRCGYLFDDEIYDRVRSNFLNISDAYIKRHIEQGISSIQESLKQQKEQYVILMDKLKKLESSFSEQSEGFDMYIRQRGMSESLERFNNQLEENNEKQITVQTTLNEITKKLKALPNKKEIEEKYVEYTRSNIITLGAWNSAYDGTIKLLTPIKAQGTLENKIILAQCIGLFQTMDYFQTQVIRFPFVVDSPRGKEASQESSKEILTMITNVKMLPQVILATIDFYEFNDSLGDTVKNANVITLHKRNSLLTEDEYIQYEPEITEMMNLFKAFIK